MKTGVMNGFEIRFTIAATERQRQKVKGKSKKSDSVLPFYFLLFTLKTLCLRW